ncbi:MAG: TRAP transporter substrate-binding protein [Desulfobacteraceae bacterium]|nr:MAG: TRAP transporter substrate-binding protein [Desulfobacteraceae bacterium]
MKRNVVLVLLALTMAAAPLLGMGQAAAAPKIIKISNGLNEKHPVLIAQGEFKKIIESRLPGKYEVQVYANSQLGDDVRATEGVRMGTLEMVNTTAAPITGLVPEFNVFDLPFIFSSEKEADAIFDGPVGAKLLALLEPKGLKCLAYLENGFRQLTNSVREVKTPEDLKRLKIRTMQNPIHLAAWKALGANPTPMPFSEVFTAMQQKTIDGQENPIPTIYLQKFYEVQKYTTLSGHIYSPFLLLINKKLFDSFPPEDQKVFQEAATEASKFERQLNRKMNTELVAELRKAGNIVTELTPEQVALFRAAVKPVYGEWVPKIGPQLVAEFQKAAAAAK